MKSFQIIIAILIGLSSTLLYQYRESISDFVNLAKSSIQNHYSKTTPSTALKETAASEAIPETHFPTPEQHQHLTVTEMSTPRAVAKVVHAIEQAEGAGARVRRSIGTQQQRNFSPFLMLDHFASANAGFPDQ
jgi:hypothetical protein